MFYLVHLERDVDLEPRMFGKNLVENLQDKVMTEVRVSALRDWLAVRAAQGDPERTAWLWPLG